MPLETEEWGIDVVTTGSQKALMTPPGLAHGVRLRRGCRGRLEVDLAALLPRLGALPEGPGEAGCGVHARRLAGHRPNVALGLILDTGLEETYDRHVRLGRACRAGAKAMGLELFSPDEDRSSVVTAIRMPEGIDGQEIVSTVRKQMGVTLAGGQGELRGKIVRIGHIGYVDIFDVVTGLAAMELALAEAGADIERGAGPARALETFEHSRV